MRAIPIGNDVTADPAIRRAVNVALDRDALVALALAGHGRPAFGPVDGLPWDNPAAHLPKATPRPLPQSSKRPAGRTPTATAPANAGI